MLIEKAAELLREQLEKLLQGSDSFDQIGRKIKSAKADVIKKYSGFSRQSIFRNSQRRSSGVSCYSRIISTGIAYSAKVLR